jgi:N-acetyl-anhydromuramoyl-L-alanine amidase
MKLDASGLVAEALYLPSPNRDERPADAAIELLVIHNISLPPGEFGGDAIIDLFLNRLDPDAHPYYKDIAALRVSSHFLIRRDGVLLQFVPCAMRAWHAGRSLWCGRERCNDFSVGIELEGSDDAAFSDAQYESLNGLARVLYSRYPIKASVGHSDIAPGRKTDPGPHFSWPRYFAGLGIKNNN